MVERLLVSVEGAANAGPMPVQDIGQDHPGTHVLVAQELLIRPGHVIRSVRELNALQPSALITVSYI